MKNISFMMLSAILTISLTACGGGNTTNSIESEVEETHVEEVVINKIAIDVNCVVPATIESYIKLQKDDKIVKDEYNSSISIYHDENGNKSVCLESGIVHIERNLE